MREYYDKFEQGYLKGLKDIKDYDQRTVANALIGISHYLGIEILFSKNITDQKKVIMDLGRYLLQGIKK